MPLAKLKKIIPQIWFILLGLACSDDSPGIIPIKDFNISANYLFFSEDEGSEVIEINNFGTIAIEWSASVTSGNFIELKLLEGRVEPNSTEYVTVGVNRQNMGEELYQSQVDLNVDVETYTVKIEVSNIPAMKLDFRVKDASYSESLNAIVAVDHTNNLHVIDPKNQNVQTLNVKFPATCLSLSPDGSMALVGHAFAYTIVDLIKFEIEKNSGITIEVFDAIYANEKWIYLFPAEDQWVSIYGHSILTNEEVSSSNNIRERTVVRKHPNENYIYGISTNSIPKDIEKYGLEGTPKVLAETPYHGDYPIGANLWINGSENYILTQAGTFFKLSDNPNEDLTYLTSLPIDNSILDAGFNHARNEIYLLLENDTFEPSSYLAIFSNELDLMNELNFPPVEFDDQLTSNMIGQFVFFDALNDQYYVLGYLPGNDSQAAILNYQLN